MDQRAELLRVEACTRAVADAAMPTACELHAARCPELPRPRTYLRER
jgi:hypothetical protein